MDIKINQSNHRYYNNSKLNKIMYKLLSTSTDNNSIRNINRLNSNLKFVYRNNLNTQINQKLIKPRLNNYMVSDFSINQIN
jgi:hypothetical protein